MIRVASRRVLCDSRRVALPPIIRSASAAPSGSWTGSSASSARCCSPSAGVHAAVPAAPRGAPRRGPAPLDRFKDAAAQSGMSLDQLIAGDGPEPRSRPWGSWASSSRPRSVRVRRPGAADAALRAPQHLDEGRSSSCATSTGASPGRPWDIYRPAVPTTLEGLYLRGRRDVLVLALYHLAIRAPIARHFSPWPPARKAHQYRGGLPRRISRRRPVSILMPRIPASKSVDRGAASGQVCGPRCPTRSRSTLATGPIPSSSRRI
jgi:hypothetical protein